MGGSSRASHSRQSSALACIGPLQTGDHQLQVGVRLDERIDWAVGSGQRVPNRVLQMFGRHLVV